MTSKVAISVPTDLLRQIDSVADAEDVSRSALFARAAAQFLGERRRRLADERYARSYRDLPETDEEMAELDSYVRSPRAWADDDDW
ncbi:MAG: ribbon-helix-helix protein, CopG family [Candidatus Dormibacteraeota bacterium]|nr:ribbon-helix-helix protein, CopG family [Candidatus Dormibacteraeota bacterium]